MSTLTLNRMPNITWHKLKMNEAEIEIADLAGANAEAITIDIPEGVTVKDDALALALDAAQAGDEWETGIGTQASEWLDTHATQCISVEVPADLAVAKPLAIHIAAQDGAAAIANVDVVVGKAAQLDITLHVDSPDAGAGLAATQVRIFAGEGATVNIASIQTLDATWQHIDNIGVYLADNARLRATQTVLGAAESYTGFATNLAGRESDAVVDTRYLGHGASKIDFNYLMRQRGVASTCTLHANGVLMDSSSKVLRGTIDLIHGAKGAVGQENETVLLVNEDVRNKTIPIILCDEDDVQGAHGATIGHVNPEQLEYMRTRGLTAEQVEDLFAVASFDYAATHAFNDQAARAVVRLGEAVLGDTYAALKEDE